MRRCYSQLASSASRAGSGLVHVREGVISVGAAPGSPVEPVSAEARSTRQAVLDKVQRSLLFEQLKPHERHEIFRPSHRTNTAGFGDRKITLDGKVVLPTKYPGLPSVSELQTIIEDAATPQQLEAALDIMRKFTDHKRLLPNLRKKHLTTILRRSAELGTFKQVYWALTCDRNRFNAFIDQSFYLEALRIFCLRVPYLSEKAKNQFYRLHMRSPQVLGRDLCLIYALAAYGQKFGAEYVKRLEPLIASATQDVQKLLDFEKNPEKRNLFHARLNNVDASIGLAGAELAGATELASLLTSALDKLNKTRTLHVVEPFANPTTETPAETEESKE